MISPARIWSPLWRTALVLLTVQIAATTVSRYVTGTEPAPPPLLANAYADPFLLIHAVSGMIALLLGPVQLVRRLRRSVPALHRATGKVYVAACALAAPSGFVLALGTTAGSVAATAFALQALLLPVFVFLGVRAATERRIETHGEWMLRAYAVIAGAVTLRLTLPAGMAAGYDFLTAYQASAWLASSINLALAEWHIRRVRGSSDTFPTLAAA
ncbi:MAG TPA: DUF2306 domain-containing protein [Allosphingosinicella sp.]|jgi:uncharacterized membrane protein